MTARELVEQHIGFAYRSLRYLGVREAELDDMLVEVFAVVYQHWSEADRHARGWVYSMCKRVANGHTAQFVPAAARSVRGEDAAFGEHLLALLPLEQREVFVLYEVENLSVPEIARALDLPVRSVHARLQAARQRVVGEVERIAAMSEHEWR